VQTCGAACHTKLPELDTQRPTGPGSGGPCELRHSGSLQQTGDYRARVGRCLRESFGIPNWPKPGLRHSPVDPDSEPMG